MDLIRTFAGEAKKRNIAGRQTEQQIKHETAYDEVTGKDWEAGARGATLPRDKQH